MFIFGKISNRNNLHDEVYSNSHLNSVITKHNSSRRQSRRKANHKMLLEASGKTSESGEEVEKFKKCGKEAQNGEISSNYLIPDPKRINKPSDFIRSLCSRSAVARTRG